MAVSVEARRHICSFERKQAVRDKRDAVDIGNLQTHCKLDPALFI